MQYLYNDVHYFRLGYFALSKGLNVKGADLQCCPIASTQHQQRENRQHPPDSPRRCEQMLAVSKCLLFGYPWVLSANLNFLLHPTKLRGSHSNCVQTGTKSGRHKVRPEMSIRCFIDHTTQWPNSFSCKETKPTKSGVLHWLKSP